METIKKSSLKSQLFRALILLGISIPTSAFNNTFEVKVGDTFTAYTTPQNGTYSIFWEYDHNVIEPVAQIYTTSNSVKFRAVAPSVGSGSIIQATSYFPSGKYVDSWKVIVEGDSDQEVIIERITLNATSHTFGLNKKDSFILEATIYPKNASNEKLIWSSSSEDVVVPETNDIYPNQIGFWCKACGTATITCIAADGGGATATCLITVVDGEKHWIKAKTVEGIEMVYYVEDATNGTCMVEGGGFNRNAQGTVTIPEIVEGEHIWESELGIERLRVVGLCNEAFAECHELTSINLPASIRTIGKNAFGWTGITSITIPDGVTELDDGVCYKCEKLVSANLPDGITKVGDMTFDGCHNLISVVIPNSVTAIGRQAFHDCHSLASISIPDGVTTIGYSAFERCVSLSSVIIPGSVTSIEDKAFDECYNLTQIQSDIVSPMPITNNTFTFIKPKETGHYELFSPTLYVPVGSKAVYQETEGWKRFVIVEGTIDASAIEDIQTDKTCDTVYSLSAQRLTSSRKGINIVGGKKIIVK